MREQRKPASPDNPFLVIEQNISGQIVAALDAWREFSRDVAERTFMAAYGSQVLQAAVGVDPRGAVPAAAGGQRVCCITN